MSAHSHDLLGDSLIYQSLLQAIPDIIYIIDDSGNFAFVNEAVRKLGHDPAELMGKHFSTLLPEGTAGDISYDHATVLLRGTATGDEAAPKLFDERRTGSRVTRNLKLRLEQRDPEGDSAGMDGEAYAVGIHRRGQEQDDRRYYGTIGIIKDVSEVTKSENTLLKTIHYYEMLIEHISDVILIVAGDGTILYASPSVGRVLDYTDADIIGENELDLLHPAERESMEQFFSNQVLWTLGEWKIECRIKNREGAWKYFDKTVKPIFDQNKITTCFVCYLDDITRQKRAEEELADSERRFRMLIESSRDIIYRYRVSPLPGFDYISPSVEDVTGYTPGEIYDHSVSYTDIIHEEDRAQLLDIQASSDVFAKPIILRLRKKEGGFAFTEHVTVPVVDGAGKLLGVEGIARDVTERRIAEEKVIASLHEKEILLKEIHHRVKNNMQIISSLLNIQAQGVRDPAVVEIFNDMKNRIHSMALIHNSLYQSNDLGRIDFEHYLPRLMQMLAGSSIYSSRRIKLEASACGFQLNVNIAVPCGLIISELVSNAIKYAFPGDHTGTVWVECGLDDGNYRFSVKDDGVGLPEDFDIERCSSMGMYIVKLLTMQLMGSLQVFNRGGAHFVITFPAGMREKGTPGG
ncbi:MAG: PAS domain S-box protein [Spirochaetes bacterium]|nr:MAG: PAS domain S-box protein [Spirochaetota bacterium]